MLFGIFLNKFCRGQRASSSKLWLVLSFSGCCFEFDKKVAFNLSSAGHALLRRLKEDADSGFRRDVKDQSGLTEDQVRLQGQVEQVLEELQDKQSKLKIYLTDRDRELGVHMDLSELEGGIKKVCIRRKYVS